MQFVDVIPIVLLIIAIAVNSAAVYLQNTKNIYSFFGTKAHFAHKLLLSFVWGGFIASLFWVQYSMWNFEPSLFIVVLGAALVFLAIILFAAAINQIGAGALNNANFFGAPERKLEGIYTYVSEPIYLSYGMALLGCGLVFGKFLLLFLAVIAAVGLIGIESRVEAP